MFKSVRIRCSQLVLEQDYSRTAVVRSLDINANILDRWMKERQTVKIRHFAGMAS